MRSIKLAWTGKRSSIIQEGFIIVINHCINNVIMKNKTHGDWLIIASPGNFWLWESVDFDRDEPLLANNQPLSLRLFIKLKLRSL